MKDTFNKILFGGSILFDLTKWIILLVIILTLISKFYFSIFVVDGFSMEPTLRDKEIVLLEKNSYENKNPQRGDVVVVKYPGDPDNKKYVKRVIGLPGEKITITNNKVFINNKNFEEDYIPYGFITVPDGIWNLSDKEYFLMGDNRPNSNDSRYFGGVEKRFFYGHAKSVVYPNFREIRK